MATKLGQTAAEIATMNPWWRSANWQRQDHDLRDVRESGLGYEPRVLSDLEPGGLYLLRGPRRVGKTVAMKQTISRLLEVGTKPLAVVRLAVDGWKAADLRTAVQRQPLPPLLEGERRWWFIDEITAVSGNWATQVKWLRDNDPEFADATVVLTGSAAAELTAGAGVLAGRRGRATHADRTLLPMGFRTFASVWQPELLELPRLKLDGLHSQAAEDAYRSTHRWIGKLVQLWELYLRYGGFPASVAAAKAGMPVPGSFVEAMFAVIHRDAFSKTSLDENQTAALVARVCESVGTPLNQRNVGQDLGLPHTTVARHLEYLRDAYLLWNCPQLAKEWLPRENAQDKVYPIDPLVGRLAHLRSDVREDLDVTALAESQIGTALRRAALREGRTWTAEYGLFYARTKTRKEIDFVGEMLGGSAVEGKYVEDGTWDKESRTVAASPYRGILATRNVLDVTKGEDGPWAVPAAVLAVLIDD